jgi:hypothetical protein
MATNRPYDPQDGRGESVSAEIERLRRQVVRELGELPLRPWRPRPPSRRQRAARTAGLVWQRSLQMMRVRA